jgi:hypothetical protein
MVKELVGKVHPVDFVRDLVKGFEPVAATNLVAGAVVAAAAALNDVSLDDPKAAAVAALWAAFVFVQRQKVRPEKAAKAVEEYAEWLEQKTFEQEQSLERLRDSWEDGDVE